MGEESVEGKEPSFLEMLYHHEEARSAPVVDEAFIEKLESLSEEDQYTTMKHLEKIGNSYHPEDTIQERVYRQRALKIYYVWYKDQTEEWVDNHYTAPEDKAWMEMHKDDYGELKDAYKTMTLEEVRELLT